MRQRRKNPGIKELFIVAFFLFVFPHLSYGAGMEDMTPSSAGDFDIPVFFNLLPVATQPGNFATANTFVNNSLASITGTPWSGNFLHSSLGFGGGFGLAYWITNRILISANLQSPV